MKNNDMFQISDNDFENLPEIEDEIQEKTGKRVGAKHVRKRENRFLTWWKSRKKWQRRTLVALTSVLLVLIILVTVFLSVFDYNYNKITKNPEDLGFVSQIDKEITNIALFGIDARKVGSFTGLSDSIMVLSINAKTKKVKIISVMRDTLVPIDYNGKTTYNKINSAYSKGGPELAIKTLNQTFGLDISEYATVNFYGMADIIDAVGGIDAEITNAELTCKNNLNDLIKQQSKYMKVSASEHLIKNAGLQHLNGIQAVAYSRIRNARNVEGTSNDYGRTDRQRYVMEQLFNKAVTMNKSQYVKLAKALIPCSETSLSYNEIISLAVNVLLSSPTFEQARVPHENYLMEGKTISGIGQCVYFDLAYASRLIHAFFYDDIHPDKYMEENGVEKNDWYKGSGSWSSSSSSRPSSQGSSTVTPSSSGNQSGSSSDDTSSDNTSSDKPDTGNSSSGTSSDDSSNAGSSSGSSDGSSSAPSSSDPSSSSEPPPLTTADAPSGGSDT